MNGIDTRMLTIKTRVMGTMRAALVVGDDNPEYAVGQATKVPPLSDKDLIPAVSCKEPYHVKGRGKRIAVIDLGIKKNIVISLRKRDADVYVYPYNASPDEILECQPDALFISNGPGDPVHATDAITCVKELAR